MPIQAHAADDTIHEFPDGTPSPVIDKAMKSYAATIPQQPNSLVDAARSIPGGLAQGAAGLVGLPSSAVNAAGNLGRWATGRETVPDADPKASTFMGLPTISQANEAVSKPFGGYYEPKGMAGEIAETAASFLPAAFGGQASLAGKLLGRVLAPAVAGASSGQLAKSAGAGPAGEATAKLAGTLIGGSPTAVVGGARALRNTLIPKLAESLAPEDAALVSQYEKMGGHLRPGQYSSSGFMRQGDAVMADTQWPRISGFGKDSATRVLPSQQSDEFNRFLSRTFGEDATRLTDDVITKAEGRIGKVYEEVLPRNTVKSDEDLLGSFAKVEENIAEAAPAMDQADVSRMAAVMNRIRSQVAEGAISGKQYQTYRQRGGILDELAGSKSPVLQRAATDIRNALDDAFIRQAQGADGAALKQAKEQFRVLQTIKPLAAKAPAGNISPGLVLGAVNKEFGSPGNAGDLGTLARVGAAFLKAQPSSGTSERSVWRSLINKPFSEGIPAVGNSIVSLPISALATRSLNKTINSPQMREKLLANAGATQLPPNVAGLARALKSQGTP